MTAQDSVEGDDEIVHVIGGKGEVFLSSEVRLKGTKTALDSFTIGGGSGELVCRWVTGERPFPAAGEVPW